MKLNAKTGNENEPNMIKNPNKVGLEPATSRFHHLAMPPPFRPFHGWLTRIK